MESRETSLALISRYQGFGLETSKPAPEVLSRVRKCYQSDFEESESNPPYTCLTHHYTFFYGVVKLLKKVQLRD